MGNHIVMEIVFEEKIYNEIEKYFNEKNWNSKLDIYIYITQRLRAIKKYSKDNNSLHYKILVSNMAHKVKNSYFVEKLCEPTINYALMNVNYNFSINHNLINYTTLEKVFKFCMANPDKRGSVRSKIKKIPNLPPIEYNREIQNCLIEYKTIDQNDVIEFMRDKNNNNLSNLIQNSLILNKELSNILENYIEDKIENNDLETKAQYRKIKRLYIRSILEFEENMDEVNEILVNNKSL